jgi:hypothetical protein
MVNSFNVATMAGSLIAKGLVGNIPALLGSNGERRQNPRLIFSMRGVKRRCVGICFLKRRSASTITTPGSFDPSRKTFSHVESVLLDADIDHATIGLIDPAMRDVQHRSWFWSGNRKPRPKQKDFEPVDKGFKMKRHQPKAKASGKGYALFSGEVS